MDLFEKYKVSATFFTVGYVAEKYPELIEEVSSKGHEIASHGYSHHDIKTVSRSEFDVDLKKSLEVLRKVSGQKVVGFRAPYCSINKTNFWAFRVLKKYRLAYDSSLYPVKFHYRLSEAPRHIIKCHMRTPSTLK